MEVLNDTNREIINFYKVVQNDFVSLEKEVRISLHSRSMHNDAYAIYTNPHLFNEVKAFLESKKAEISKAMFEFLKKVKVM